MKKQLFINEMSLIVATAFLITTAFTKNIYLLILAFVMIGYSATRIKKLKR